MPFCPGCGKEVVKPFSPEDEDGLILCEECAQTGQNGYDYLDLIDDEDDEFPF